jgi:hypothetical protein
MSRCDCDECRARGATPAGSGFPLQPQAASAAIPGAARMPAGLLRLTKQGEDYIWRPAQEAYGEITRLAAVNAELVAALTAIVDRDFTFFSGAMVGASKRISYDEIRAGRAAIARATGSTT